MKNKLFFTVLFVIISVKSELYAQDSLKSSNNYPYGISLEYGIGNYAVTDEYISKEKYSGKLPYYKIGWSRLHENYVYYLGIEYRNSSEIKNYNVSADIYEFSLNQGFIYSLPTFTFLDKNVYTYLGPSTELFFYYNKQNIAVSGFDYSQSFAALFSLGLCTELIYPILDDFNIEGSIRFTVLSLGFRSVDSEESDVSPVKPLTFLSGINGMLYIGTRYYLFENLSLKFGYRFSSTRIDAWDKLLTASDNLIFGLTYGF